MPLPPAAEARHRVATLAALLAAAAATVFALLAWPPGAGAASPVSPLLWGENISIDPTAASDWFLSSADLRTGLQTAHTQIVRLPVRGPASASSGIANWSEFQQAATDLHELGMTPLVILRNPQDPALADDDTQVVRYITNLFGETPVYYEWGNETDLSGDGYVPASTYVDSWNATVPGLKAIAGPHAKWIGPANAHWDPDYFQTFLQSANPRPDAVSWHEYPCPSGDSDDDCLTQTSHWTNHITEARSLMTNTIDTQLPIWITEWNYSSSVAGDDRHTDTAFISKWTTTAFQLLATNGVQAAMHFNVDNDLPLATSDGALTAQGTVAKTQYEALVGGSSASPSTLTADSTPQSAIPTPETGTGQQYYVSASAGNDSTGDGSSEHPWASIAHAADVVKPGSDGATVHVAAGDYPTPVHNTTSGQPGAYLTFISDQPWGARIAPSTSDFPIRNDGDYVRIIGFDVTSTGGAWSGILTYGTHNIIQGNHVHDIKTDIDSSGCNGSPGGDGIGDDQSASDNTFAANVVDNIGPYPTECEYIHGIYPSGARDVIVNNIAYHNSGNGITFNHNETGATIANNLSFANGDHGISISSGGGQGDNFVITNNITLDNDGVGINVHGDANGAHNQYLNNLFYQNQKGQYGLDSSDWTPPNASGTLSADPEQVNYTADGGDYHLTPDSPAIDAGTTTGAPATDYDGLPRPQGTAIDIGPFEYSATPTPSADASTSPPTPTTPSPSPDSTPTSPQATSPTPSPTDPDSDSNQDVHRHHHGRPHQGRHD